ncbi:MAG: DinB family protein, partial [Terriglobales bacterium]
MKAILAFLVLSVSLHAYGQDNKTHTLKSILLDQLRSTHNVAGWFAPTNTAVEGLTAEQASWKPKDDEHSIGQLAN